MSPGEDAVKCLAMVVVWFGVCATVGAQHPRVWCVGESSKVKPGDPPQEKNLTWDGATKTVTLGSARNEYVAFQVVIHGGQEGLKDVTVVAGGLKGSKGALIPAGNMDLFLEHYLNVTVTSRSDPKHIFRGVTPGEHPVQMVPFNARKFGAPFMVGAGRNQPVWVDVYVPEEAAPGDYAGTFKVKIGGEEASEVKVALTVWTFTLPHETHFRTFLYTGPENLRWGHHLTVGADDLSLGPLYDAYFQMAHQHRLNFHPTGGSGLEEVLGRFYKYYDGSAFTNRVGKGVGQNLALITPEGNTEEEFKAFARKIVEKCEARRLSGTLRPTEEIRELPQGRAKRPAEPRLFQVVSYIWDEPHSDRDFAESKKRCKWVHEAVGRKLLAFIATPQWQRYDAGDVDIFSEPRVADIPKIVERGSGVWAVNGGYGAGPYVDSPGFGGRSIALMNWKMKLGGWQFWDCCYWLDKQCLRKRGFTYAKANANPAQWMTDVWNDPLTFDETRKPGYPERDALRINGDGVLFYPGYEVGVKGPIASYQMKSLRRGAQDYEYLWLLRAAGKEKEADAILATVCPAPGQWNEDPERWEEARLAWARLLDRSTLLCPATRSNHERAP